MAKQERMYQYFLRSNLKNVSTTSKELEGLMIMEKPYSHDASLSLGDFIRGIPLFKLGSRTLVRMIHYQIHATAIRKQLIQDPYWYLSLIVVAPQFQGQGFASRLLKPILYQAEREKQRVFLETHHPENIPIYERFGFQVVNAVTIAQTNFHHFCLIR